MTEEHTDTNLNMHRLYRCGVCGLMSADIEELKNHMLASHLQRESDLATNSLTDQNDYLNTPLHGQFSTEQDETAEYRPETSPTNSNQETPVVESQDKQLPTDDQEVDLNFKVKMPSTDMAMFPKHIKPALFFTCTYCDYKHQSFKDVSIHISSNHPKKLDQRLRAKVPSTSQDVSVINNTAYITRKRKTLKKTKSLLYESTCEPEGSEQHRTFSCALCHTKCSRQLVLDIHKRCHIGNSKKLQCCFCGKAAPIAKAWYGLYIHMVNKHPVQMPAPHSCSVCGKGFVKLFDLQRHMSCHSKERPYACQYCTYTFKNKKNLHDHEVLKHKLGTEQEREALIKRIRSRPRPELDEKLPWLRCANCSYKTKVKSKFNIHSKIHSGVKDIVCSYCEYKTHDKSALRRHEWRHRTEKPFSCKFCDFSCIQRPQIHAHYKNKHSLLPTEAVKLVQHINGPRVYNPSDLDLEPDPSIGLQQIVVADPNTINIQVDGDTTAVDLDLLTEAAEGLLAASQIELHTS
ncbi:zinc finger protein 64-like [Watersipora subatra]|uniref:zinc finger protein 64-like n=1 Tax=Watersipora subatra TaxID=2589382 RepID=UPI00355BC26B